jgi:hypothetical protein
VTDRFFIYQHKTADTGVVFYIGKGTLKKGTFERAYVSKKRSKFWQAIVEKHGLVVEVLESFSTEAAAFDREKELIALHGRRADGGTLCNLTLGGDGACGVNVTPETRERLRAAVAGEKHPNWGKRLSTETCRKKSETMKASPHSLKGKQLPDWWKQRIAATKVGDLNPMHGRRGSDHPTSRAIINSGYGLVFESVTEAAEFYGMKMKTLYNQLTGHRPNKLNLEFA